MRTLCAGLSAVISDAVHVDTTHAQPQRNPALTGQLVTNAHREPSLQPPAADEGAKHYHAKTTHRTNWFFIFLYTLSVIASLLYFAVRIYYIAVGKSSVKIPINTSIPSGNTKVTVSEALTEFASSRNYNQVDEDGEALPDGALDEFAALQKVCTLQVSALCALCNAHNTLAQLAVPMRPPACASHPGSMCWRGGCMHRQRQHAHAVVPVERMCRLWMIARTATGGAVWCSPPKLAASSWCTFHSRCSGARTPSSIPCQTITWTGCATCAPTAVIDNHVLLVSAVWHADYCPHALASLHSPCAAVLACQNNPGLTRRHFMQIVAQKGKLQQVNVMVCTYNEDCETVEKCVRHLLASPQPVYCNKHIYIGDDGAKKAFQCSEDKRQMVERLRRGAQLLCLQLQLIYCLLHNLDGGDLLPPGAACDVPLQPGAGACEPEAGMKAQTPPPSAAALMLHHVSLLHQRLQAACRGSWQRDMGWRSQVAAAPAQWQVKQYQPHGAEAHVPQHHWHEGRSVPRHPHGHGLRPPRGAGVLCQVLRCHAGQQCGSLPGATGTLYACGSPLGCTHVCAALLSRMHWWCARTRLHVTAWHCRHAALCESV